MTNKNIIFLTIFVLLHSTVFSETSHIIKKGETLYRLATIYNTTVDEIINRNNVTDINSIGIGTKLIIPSNESVGEISSAKYTVVKGDTLFSISKKFNLSLSVILEYNNLEDGDIISLGQVLLLPYVDIYRNYEPKPEPEPEETSNDIGSVVLTNVPFWPLDGSRKEYSGRIQGVEIKGEPGDYIKAVSAGKVIWYDSYKGIGKVVLIEGENGYDYLYGTKENLNVKMGISIKAGDRLGRLKENNTSLIFSVFKNGKPLNDISRAPR